MAVAQLITEEGRSFYELNHYRIYPEEKAIEEGRMIGGIDWDGYAFFKDERIHYETTALVFLNGEFRFKEYLSHLDLPTLQLLYPQGVYPNGSVFISAVFIDKNNVYYNGSAVSGEVGYYYPLPDTQTKKRVHPYLWQDKKGTLYLMPQVYTGRGVERFMFSVDEMGLDVASFKHLYGYLYADKNGLYWLQEPHEYMNQKEGSVQVETNTGQPVATEIVYEYVGYGENVYYRPLASIRPTLVEEKISDIKKRFHDQALTRSTVVGRGVVINKEKGFQIIPREKIQRIGFSNYATDGQTLFYYDFEQHHAKDAGEEYEKLQTIPANNVVEGIDLPTVQIINTGLILDKNNIYNYYRGEGKVQVLPRDKLGFEVMVFMSVFE